MAQMMISAVRDFSDSLMLLNPCHTPMTMIAFSKAISTLAIAPMLFQSMGRKRQVSIRGFLQERKLRKWKLRTPAFCGPHVVQ